MAKIMKRVLCVIFSILLLSNVCVFDIGTFAQDTSGVISYEELSSQYDNFVYLATEFYNEAGVLLPHDATINEGETLTVKLYYKTDLAMYYRQELLAVFDSSLFDVQEPSETPPLCKSVEVVPKPNINDDNQKNKVFGEYIGVEFVPFDFLDGAGYSARQIEQWCALKFILPYTNLGTGTNRGLCTVDLTSDEPLATFSVKAKNDAYHGYACIPKEIFTACSGDKNVPGKMAINGFGNYDAADVFISDCDYSFSVAVNADYEIGFNDSVSAEISAGDSKLIKFTPGVSGNYIFSSGSYSYGCSCRLYDSDMTVLMSDDDGGGFRIETDMTAGETYYYKIKFRDAGVSGTVTASMSHSHKDENADYRCDICNTILSHTHTDENDDGACDICSEQYYYPIQEGQTLTITVTGGKLTYLRFIPQVTGTYIFYSSSNSDTRAYLYDSGMCQLAENDDGGNATNFLISYQLTAGETYYYGCEYYNSSYSGSYDVTLTHTHIDENEDYRCDICNTVLSHTHIDANGDDDCDICYVTYRYSIDVSGERTVEIPPSDMRELIFNCDITGRYKVISTYEGSYSDWLFYDENGNQIETENGYYFLESGKIYIIRVNNYNSSLSTRFFTLTHGHTDLNGDLCCDICGEVYRYEITEDTPLEISISAGSFVEILINCEKTGEYSFTTQGSYNGWSFADSEGNGVEYGSRGYLLTAGETYICTIKAYDGYDSAITAELKHIHNDADGDCKCDICGTVFRFVIEENESVTIDIPAREQREIAFTCERTGQYIFIRSSMCCSFSGIYTSSGDYVSYNYNNLTGGYTVNFTEGTTYIFRFTGSSSSGYVKLTLKHAHIDADGDYACDICNFVYRFEITESTPLALTIPYDEQTEAVFTCERTGEYLFTYSGNENYSSNGIYSSEGTKIGNLNSALELTEGQTYSLKLSWCDYWDEGYCDSTEITVLVKHSHIDEDGDYECDICNTTYRYEITEGEPLTLTVTSGEQTEAVFSCERTGLYQFVYSDDDSDYNSFYGIYTSSGDYVSYNYNNLTGGYTVNFTEGTTYIFRFRNGYGSSVTLTLKHIHIDEDGDNKCDICDTVFRFTIEENEPVTIDVPFGEQREAVFVCTRTGEYSFSSHSSNYDIARRIYDSDGYGAQYGNNGFLLTEGEVYIVRLANRGSESDSTEVTVLVKHSHIDEDGDCECDICNFVYRYEITEGIPLTLTVPFGEQREAVFSCERTGEYRFTYLVSNHNSFNGIYTSAGDYVSYDYYGSSYDYDYSQYAYTVTANLTEGITYIFRFAVGSSSDNDSVTLTLRHTHIDEDGNFKCDICNFVYRYEIAEDIPLTMTVPSGEQTEAVFTCERTGEYRFACSGSYYSFNDIYTSSGNYVHSDYDYGGYTANLTEGTTYLFRFTGDSSSDNGSVTLTLKHAHIDEDGDCECDLCSRTVGFVIEEDVPLTVEISGNDCVSVYFTPDRDNWFTVNTSSCYLQDDIYDSDGNPAQSSSNAFLGKTQYYLNKDVRYELLVYNDYSEDSEGTVTVTHAHSGEEQTAVESTAASLGLKSLNCAECGQTLYATVNPAGSIVTDGNYNGFYYTVYRDSNGEEIAVHYYSGDETQIIIPESINGIPVTTIEGDEIVGLTLANPDITTVVIPQTVRSIGESAFILSTGLTEINIPDSVSVIDELSFAGCINLSTVRMSKNVRYIGENAFMFVPSEEIRQEVLETLEFLNIEIDDMLQNISAYEEAMNQAYTDLDAQYAEFFADISGKAEAEIDNWDDLYSYVENTDESELVEKFGLSGEELISEIDSEKEQYNQQKSDIDSEKAWLDMYRKFYTGLPAAYQSFADTVESPLNTVIYGGNEQNWADVTVLGGNENLTDASWTYNGEIPSDLFTLTYDANGGTGAPASRTGNGSITLSGVIPSREGFAFLGWASTDNASEAEYAPEAAFSLDRDTVLYAVWQEEIVHTHDYTETVTSEPTCTESGVKTFTCECGDSYTENIPPLGHDIIHHDGKASTCQEKGYAEYDTCSRCDYTTYSELPLSEHISSPIAVENSTESTCQKAGEYDEVVYCSICGKELSSEHKEKEPGQHIPLDPVKENYVKATCTEAGSYESVIKCGVCGNEISRETITENALGHDIIHHSGKTSTCEEKGYAEYDTCSRCDYTTYSELPLSDHTPSATVRENEVAATCEKAGKYDSVVYCSVCGDELSRKTETIAKTVHKDADNDGMCDFCQNITDEAKHNTYLVGKAKLNVKASATVDYRSTVTVTATASGVPEGYYLAIYEGNTLKQKGDNKSVSFNAGEMTADKTFTVRIIDEKNAVQKDSNGKAHQKNVEVKVKQGFFDKLIAFFKGLFRILPVVELKP